MSQTAACQTNGTVSMEGTVTSTASRTVHLVVRGSTYDTRGIKTGSGSDFIGIDPHGTSAYHLIVPTGCGKGDWDYRVLIDEVL